MNNTNDKNGSLLDEAIRAKLYTGLLYDPGNFFDKVTKESEDTNEFENSIPKDVTYLLDKKEGE